MWLAWWRMVRTRWANRWRISLLLSGIRLPSLPVVPPLRLRGRG
ncbi:hypothetical protein JD77_00277 [Micromonospora olivasterospora]|uniref:Uncharacterized protein n=1 Tax=Micromonospora olivasterospora TaxID=1880 RepID=A0A562I3G7_MICOL|nr:hypothetical protein JD77_00179 [Micromonospora olivasterospora]TWH65341.1 hypothetical protein JD77_00277 [Micromonospora olivasterospora]